MVLLLVLSGAFAGDWDCEDNGDYVVVYWGNGVEIILKCPDLGMHWVSTVF